ncbi:MAG: hypothetical protein IJ395_04310 [Clostridia bacterium]|nr:hypothetical protein [Clostridia bacterium]
MTVILTVISVKTGSKRCFIIPHRNNIEINPLCNKRHKKSPETLIYQGFPDFFLAGAEGLEPSARGFGVHPEV